MEWRGRSFTLLAHSEKEAREWWRTLSDREREELLGMAAGLADDGPGLF
jgi:type II secretory pathway component PulM